MDALTVGALVALDGYLLFRLVRVRKALGDIGPLIGAGLAAGFAAVALGQIGILRRDAAYGTYMSVAAALCLVLVLLGLWQRYKLPR